MALVRGGEMTKNLLWLSCATSALVLGATSAHAATATATAAASSETGGTVAELVVVAEHRETALQKIPVAVSVFTGAERDIIGINSVQDVTNFAPGFTYDPGDVHAYIRGVGRQSVNVTDDQRVSTYEDEFVVYSPYGLDKSSLFLAQEQIERGPQNVGGRNAAAGSIDMISVRPTDHPYAELRVNVGNFGTYNFEGAVSGQIANNLDARLAFYDHNSSGYYTNLILPRAREGNDIHEWYVEGQIDWKPNDKFEFWARAFDDGWANRGDAGARNGIAVGSWDETSLTDGNAYVAGGLFVNPNFGYAAPNGNPLANAALTQAQLHLGDPDPTPVSVTLYNPTILDNPSTTNPNVFAAPIERTTKLDDYMGFNYIATYKFDNDVEFKYVGGIQNYNYRLDYSGTDTDVKSFTLPGSTANCAALAPFGLGGLNCPTAVNLFLGGHLPAPTQLVINPTIAAQYIEDDWWTAHDFLFESTGKSPFQWTVGAFTYYQHYNQPYTVWDPNQPNLANPLYALPNPITLLGAIPAPANLGKDRHPSNIVYDQDYNFNVNDDSVYGQFSYAFNDQFKFTGNLRYSYDHKWGTEYTRAIFFGSALIDGLSPFFGEATPSLDFTPELICATGDPANCNGGPLAKGVLTKSVIGPDGYASRKLGDSSSAVTGGAGVEWTPTNDIFVYARYGRGYESLSFNAGPESSVPEVAPEYLNAYELGYKQTFGHNLSIDIAAFYWDYENMQIPVDVNNGGVTQAQFFNVPKAVSDGIEVEGNWAPVKDLLLTLSYSYDHTAVLTKCTGTINGGGALVPNPGALCIIDTNDPAAIQPGANPFPGQTTATKDQGVNGNPLPNAPLHKFAFSGAYTWHFAPGDLTFDGTFAYRSAQDGTLFNRFYDNAPAWQDVDLRLTWKGPQDRYEVIGYVKNLFNTLQYEVGGGAAGLNGSASSVNTATNGINAAGAPTLGLNELLLFTLAPPRTFGVELRYKFF